MTKIEMSYLTAYYAKIKLKNQKITEKTKKYLRNVVTNVILDLSTRFSTSQSGVQLSSKGAGNYALYHVRKKY